MGLEHVQNRSYLSQFKPGDVCSVAKWGGIRRGTYILFAYTPHNDYLAIDLENPNRTWEGDYKEECSKINLQRVDSGELFRVTAIGGIVSQNQKRHTWIP